MRKNDLSWRRSFRDWTSFFTAAWKKFWIHSMSEIFSFGIVFHFILHYALLLCWSTCVPAWALVVAQVSRFPKERKTRVSSPSVQYSTCLAKPLEKRFQKGKETLWWTISNGNGAIIYGNPKAILGIRFIVSRKVCL